MGEYLGWWTSKRTYQHIVPNNDGALKIRLLHILTAYYIITAHTSYYIITEHTIRYNCNPSKMATEVTIAANTAQTLRLEPHDKDKASSMPESRICIPSKSS